MDKKRLLELAGIQLNESVEAENLRRVDAVIEEAIKNIAEFYVSEGDDPIEAREAASDAVFEHLKHGQRT